MATAKKAPEPTSPPRLLALAGSLRKDSYNRKLVRIAAEGATGGGAQVTLVELQDFPLPLYDGDSESSQGQPEAAHRLRELFIEHQGLLIASPEFNGSVSAVLKNVIDWVSRASPEHPSRRAFHHKVAAVMSASTGGFGGVRGLQHLRSILEYTGIHVLPDMLALSHAAAAFDEQGKLKDPARQAECERLGRRAASAARHLEGYFGTLD